MATSKNSLKNIKIAIQALYTHAWEEDLKCYIRLFL